MALGKYSPTVSASYSHNQEWFREYAGEEIYDPEGYDPYGYDKDEVDRAGNKEEDYYDEENGLYEEVSIRWASIYIPGRKQL